MRSSVLYRPTHCSNENTLLLNHYNVTDCECNFYAVEQWHKCFCELNEVAGLRNLWKLKDVNQCGDDKNWVFVQNQPEQSKS